jgi:uncharacterized protein YegP (UPF0339 family)
MNETKKQVRVYEDKAGEWRWSKKSGGDIVADSGEGYKQKATAVERAEKEAGDEYEVVVEEGGD